jgi:hypothetical protein
MIAMRPQPMRSGVAVTVDATCSGLTDEQSRVALPPSPITLGGLLKHLACVEDSWFTEVVAGQPLPEPWASLAFEAALGRTHPVLYWGEHERVSLRWVLAHMIEEYARHNGHADLIRESIDGQTGE